MRAPLAILVGITLQALLIPHGGLTTIGVNTCVEAIPALLCAALFPLLRDTRSHWARRGLVAFGALVLGACVLAAAAVLITTPWGQVLHLSPSAGVVVSAGSLEPMGHPAALVLLAALVVGSLWLDVSPRFAAGAVVGLVGVIGTLLLTGLILILDGAEKWAVFVSAVFVVHLPLAVVEALILGVAVRFLARVKPEMVGVRPEAVAAAVLLLATSPAWAHGLETNYKIDRAAKSVVVKVFFETGDAPENGQVKVFNPAGHRVAEGATDKDGDYRFTYAETVALHVEAKAEGGHAARFTIPASELQGETATGGPRETRWGDLAAGVALLLALAAFVQSWLNARRLRRIEERLAARP